VCGKGKRKGCKHGPGLRNGGEGCESEHGSGREGPRHGKEGHGTCERRREGPRRRKERHRVEGREGPRHRREGTRHGMEGPRHGMEGPKHGTEGSKGPRCGKEGRRACECRRGV